MRVLQVRNQIIVLLLGLTIGLTMLAPQLVSAQMGGVANYSPIATDVNEQSCTNLGRQWTTYNEQMGCSRQVCVAAGAGITGDYNTESCVLRGVEYGANLESRLCKRLGRQWIPTVNRCLQNVARGQMKVIDNAPQCQNVANSYVVIPANRGYDICVSKSQADAFIKTAAAQRTTVAAVAFNRSKVLCDTTANFDWKNGACKQLRGNEQKDKIRKSTFVLGDSVTYRANDEITARNPTWEVDGQPGTAIQSALKRYREYTNTHTTPKVFVIALGTNGTQGISKENFIRTANLVPRSTTVVFVTPYRDGKIYGKDIAKNMNKREQWMKEIARSRPNTCIAPWKTTVENNPGLVIDGVHETPQAEATFANVVTRAVKSCR